MEASRNSKITLSYWRFALGSWLLLLVAVMPATAASSQVITGLSEKEVHEVIGQSRWSIIKMKTQAHQSKKASHLTREDDISEKDQLKQNQEVRLGHRDINKALNYRKVKFLSPVNFQQSHFFASPVVTLTQFGEGANFSSATFDHKVAFEWVIFDEKALFSHTLFSSEVSFYGGLFKQGADFHRSHFTKKTLFNAVHFLENAGFSYARFDRGADFSTAKFEGEANFSNAIIKGEMNLSGAEFSKDLNLIGASFEKGLDLSGAQVGGNIIANGTVLPEYLNLSNMVKIKGVVDLTGAKKPLSQGKCQLILIGADLSKIKFRYGQVHIAFPPTASHEQKMAVYEGALNMLTQNGFKESYRQVMREYQQYRYHREGRWLVNIIQDYGWDYGFDPERIFYWIFVILLFFTSVNTLFYRSLVEQVMDLPFLRGRTKSKIIENNIILRYIFYFPMTFIYTIFFLFSSFFGFKNELGDLKSKSLWVNIYIVISMFTGVICSFFILNYLIGG